MELPLKTYSVSEMRSVIHFLTVQKKTSKEIHKQLCHVYGEQGKVNKKSIVEKNLMVGELL